MLNKEIEFLKIRYGKILQIVDIQKQAEADTINFFDFNEGKETYDKSKFDKYSNPFYDRFEETIRKIRDSTISFIIHLFHSKYPNVPLSSSEFDAFVSKDQYGNKDLVIDFDKVQVHIDKTELNREKLAKADLVKDALNLIPHELTRGESYRDKIAFKLDGILKTKKLQLWCGYSYTWPNKEHIPSMLKLINVVLKNQEYATAEEIDSLIYLKYYKNGRLDIDFDKHEDAEKVAEFLVTNQNEK